MSEGGSELRLVEFLAVLAALLGVVYSVFPAEPGFLGAFPARDLFAGYLIFFMMYSAVAYASMLRGRPNSRNLANGSLALFSILLAFEFVFPLTTPSTITARGGVRGRRSQEDPQDSIQTQ